jgi:hypothetical protein
MIRFRQVAAVALLAGMMAAALAGGSDAAARKPFRIYGNTYYVGTANHASILVSSDYGYLLIDTGPKEAAAQVAANIQALGFKLSDLKAIVVSDARPEHAGGVGSLQALSGAQVYTARAGEQKLRDAKLPVGKPLKNDPREGARMGAIPMLPQVWVVQDDQLLSVSSVRLRAIATPSGTPEGMSWSFDRDAEVHRSEPRPPGRRAVPVAADAAPGRCRRPRPAREGRSQAGCAQERRRLQGLRQTVTGKARRSVGRGGVERSPRASSTQTRLPRCRLLTTGDPVIKEAACCPQTPRLPPTVSATGPVLVT